MFFFPSKENPLQVKWALMPAKMEFFMGFAIEEGYEALIAKKPESMNEGITSNPSGSGVEG